MGVYIKGMEMPKSCAECDAEGHYENSYGGEYGFFCPFGYKAYTEETRDAKRLDNCPLVPIPPHGRLIDADVLEDNATTYYAISALSNAMDFDPDLVLHLQKIDNAPTVIEAEEGE